MRSSSTRSISGIAARERIADDDEIGRGIEIRFGVGLEDRNAKRAQQIAHGRIGGLVGAGDAMALQLQKPGERSHRRAADADQVNVLRRCVDAVITASPPVPADCNCASSPTRQLGCHAEGERDILPRDMAAAQADRDGSIEIVETRCRITSSSNSGAAPGEAQSSISPKTMPRTSVEFARVAQLPQHAIDLVGLGARVFKEEQLAFGGRLPGRAQQRNENAEAAAVERAPRRTWLQDAQAFAGPTNVGLAGQRGLKAGKMHAIFADRNRRRAMGPWNAGRPSSSSRRSCMPVRSL